MGIRRTSTAGFTLMEVLVASALAAFLMASVLVILTAVVRDRAKLRIALDPTVELEPVLRLVCRDVSVAREFSEDAGGGSLTLIGCGGLDPQTRVPNGCPARVTYQVQDLGGRRWLVRTQSFLDEDRRATPQMELVSGNVEGILLQPLDSEQAGSLTLTREVVPEAGPVGDRGVEQKDTAENRRATLSGEIPPVLSIRLTIPGGRTVQKILVTR